MSGQIYHHREMPYLPGRTPVQKLHTPSGTIYVPAYSEVQEPQALRGETYRTTERRFIREDGIEGVETVTEHDVRYAPAVNRPRVPASGLTKALTGVGLFSVAAVAWSELGAVPAHLALYLLAAIIAYHWITR